MRNPKVIAPSIILAKKSSSDHEPIAVFSDSAFCTDAESGANFSIWSKIVSSIIIY